MSIQFTCTGCRQPIEVDNEWANQTVMCPYCRYVQNAPAESTFRPESIQAASPARIAAPPPSGGFGTVAPPPPGTAAPPWVTGMPTAPAVGSNALGTAAIVLGTLAWVFLIAGLAASAPALRDSVQAIKPNLDSRGRPINVTEKELNQKLQEQIQQKMLNDPAFQSQYLRLMLFIVLAEGCGVAGVIVGIIGLTRQYASKTRPAIGLALAGAFLPGQCLAFGVAINLLLAT